MNDKLSAQISEGELKEAMWALPKNKCPREDGSSVFFFQEYWDVIGHRLLDVCTRSLTRVICLFRWQQG